MQGILVRVGIDTAFGGWNAPVAPDSNRFLYIPIPEKAIQFHRGCERRYDEVAKPLASFLNNHGANGTGSHFRLGSMLATPMHLDPDFEHLTYGDDGDRRGSDIRKLKAEDLLVFYAGLRPITPCADRLIYAIVGLFVVERVVSVSEVTAARRHENAHTRKVKLGPGDIVVRARPGVSGRCERCVPVGEFRDRAYRVKTDVLKQWGGLSVKDGFLQRSAVPPRFTDTDRFYRWWKKQDIKLVRKNFSE